MQVASSPSASGSENGLRPSISTRAHASSTIPPFEADHIHGHGKPRGVLSEILGRLRTGRWGISESVIHGAELSAADVLLSFGFVLAIWAALFVAILLGGVAAEALWATAHRP
jgi:hypothetical protein